MKKCNSLIIVLCAWSLAASAQITQENANTIAKQYVQNAIGQPATLYINEHAPSPEGISITTSQGETFRAKYACWAYFVNETAQRRYLFVKASDGSVLEVIANNDESSSGNWKSLDATTGIDWSNKTMLFPNPVSDVLNIPCNGLTRVEIYDMQGNCVFSEQVFGGKSCQLSLSFLKSGVYMVYNGNQTYRIVKQ